MLVWGETLRETQGRMRGDHESGGAEGETKDSIKTLSYGGPFYLKGRSICLCLGAFFPI